MRRIRSISRLTLVVLVALSALSVGGWALVRHSVQRQDQAVLENDAGQINLLFQTALQNLQSQLRSLAFFTIRSGYSPSVFAAQAKPLLTSPSTSVALVDTSGAQPRVVLAVGAQMHAGQPLPSPLAAAAARDSIPLASGVVQMAGQRLIYLESAPSTNPRFVALQTSVLSARPVPNSTGPYSKVYLNLYDGPTAQPDRLILTTYGPGHLPGRTAMATTRFGSVTWLIQVAAKSPPAGAYTDASPWLVLATGLVVAVVFAALTQLLVRRRQQAEALAAEMERVADDNRRLYTEQRSVAETLQAALLPETLPAPGAVEAAVRYLPGVEGIHVGGDWYDLIALDDSHLLAVVGDVAGRGVRAAGVMASLMHGTRAYAAQGDPPTQILTKLSNIVTVERTSLFATVLLVQLDLAGGQMTIVNGGHPPPLLLHNGHGEFVQTDVGLPVGVSTGPTYTEVTVPVATGDTLLAFTDGLVERRGESLDAGFERLRSTAVRERRDTLDALLSTVVGSLVGEGAADDTVLLGVRWRA